jgi:hypothetical protein
VLRWGEEHKEWWQNSAVLDTSLYNTGWQHWSPEQGKKYDDWTLDALVDAELDVSERANMADPMRGWWEEAQDGADLRKVPKGFPAVGLPHGMTRHLPVGLAGAFPPTTSRRFGW